MRRVVNQAAILVSDSFLHDHHEVSFHSCPKRKFEADILPCYLLHDFARYCEEV